MSLSAPVYPPGVTPTWLDRTPEDLDLICDAQLFPDDLHFWREDPSIVHELMDASGLSLKNTPEMKDILDEIHENNEIFGDDAWIEIGSWMCPAVAKRQHDLGPESLPSSWSGPEDCPIPGTNVLDIYDEYLLSLIPERRKNSEVNLHRFLATPHEDRGKVWGQDWVSNAGQTHYDEIITGSDETISPDLECESITRFCKDRIKDPVFIKTAYPDNKRGYATGLCDFGKVYIPEKFRGYIPDLGESVIMTFALQDASSEKGCRLTCIYIH
jgi:hypothetical protein